MQTPTGAEIAKLAQAMWDEPRKSGTRSSWDAQFEALVAKIRAARTEDLIDALGRSELLPIADPAPYFYPLREAIASEIARKNAERVAKSGDFVAWVGIGLAALQVILAVVPYFKH